jgi:hypothetical protein
MGEKKSVFGGEKITLEMQFQIYDLMLSLF